MHRQTLLVSLILCVGLTACVSDRAGEEIPQTPAESSANGTVTATNGEAMAVAPAVIAIPELADHPMGAFVSLGEVTGTGDQRVLDVSMATVREVSGFQFRMSGATPIAGQGGRAGDLAFNVDTNEETRIVIGYNFNGAAIPSGDGTLTRITVRPDPGASEICLTAPVFGDREGDEVETILGGCVPIE